MLPLLCLGLSSLAAAAQEPLPASTSAPASAPDSPAAASQIVVTGRGLDPTPAAPAYDSQQIDGETLASSASGRIEDTLSDVAGFQQYRRSDSRASNPSNQGVTLRALGGNATSRSLVLLDGVPMADPFFGYIPFSAMAPERLASARVTRGGGAGAFGAGAVAGTIELTSADAATLGLLNVSALADQRGETELSGTFAPKLGQGFIELSGRWDRGEGFWTTPVDQRVPASVRARYESRSLSLRAVTPLTEDIELQFHTLWYDDARTLRFAGADSSSTGQDVSLRLVGHGPWQFDVLGYVQARDFSNVVISSSSFLKTLDQYATPSTGWGGKAELRPPVGGHHALKLGSDWRRASGTAAEAAYAATGAVTARRWNGGANSDIGFYAEDDWTHGALTLTAGARVDRWSIADGESRQIATAGTTDSLFPNRAGWDPSFRGGAVIKLGHGLDLRGAAYTGMRQPTLNELYRSFSVFPVTTQANPLLRNEHLKGYEAGIDFTPVRAVLLAVTAFDNRLKDAIANVTIGTNLQQRFNVPEIRARGIELTAHAAVGQFTLDGSYAFTDSKVKGGTIAPAATGLRPAQTPRHAASATLSWQPRVSARLALTVRHIGAQYEDDINSSVIPAATTLNAFAEYPLTRAVSLVLRGENLTNVDVITRNQAGSIDLGAPRTVWMGVKARIP